MLGGLARQAVAGLVYFEAESDPGDPTRYVIFVGQGGIGLPDEAYYRLDEHAAVRDQYREHIAASFELAGIADPVAQAQQVFDLETEIAAAHWDKVKCRDMRLMYNLMTLDDFITTSPSLHWRAFLAGAEVSEQAMAELVVAQPSFFSQVAESITDERMGAWKSWAKWKLVTSLSPYLSAGFVDERFRFYGTVLSGPRCKAVEAWRQKLVEGALGEAVGRSTSSATSPRRQGADGRAGGEPAGAAAAPSPTSTG